MQQHMCEFQLIDRPGIPFFGIGEAAGPDRRRHLPTRSPMRRCAERERSGCTALQGGDRSVTIPRLLTAADLDR